MNRKQVLHLFASLKIEKCPSCGSHEIQLHTDRFFIVNTQKTVVSEPEIDEKENVWDEVTEITCRKCGTRLTMLQDIVIFKTAILEHLKNRLQRQPTAEEFLQYVDILETDIPTWLQNKSLDTPNISTHTQ